MSETIIISTLTGNLKLSEKDSALTHCYWTQEKTHPSSSSLLNEAAKQLQSYFEGKLRVFDLPLNPEGTDFQKRVWQALLTIPYGKTWSYQTLASHVNNPKAVRAVGNANGKNPLCILIPCHRVIYASGKIGGYSAGLGYKEKLLKLEA